MLSRDPLQIWASAPSTRVKVERGETVLREGVNRQVRFGEQRQPGDAARLRKDVPPRRADDFQVQQDNQPLEQRGKLGLIAEPGRAAAARVDQPLLAGDRGIPSEHARYLPRGSHIPSQTA